MKDKIFRHMGSIINSEHEEGMGAELENKMTGRLRYIIFRWKVLFSRFTRSWDHTTLRKNSYEHCSEPFNEMRHDLGLILYLLKGKQERGNYHHLLPGKNKTNQFKNNRAPICCAHNTASQGVSNG